MTLPAHLWAGLLVSLPQKWPEQQAKLSGTSGRKVGTRNVFVPSAEGDHQGSPGPQGSIHKPRGDATSQWHLSGPFKDPLGRKAPAERAAL